MIESLVKWLAAHKRINLLLVLAYIGFIVFAHEWFVNVSVEVMNSISLPTYQRLVASLSVGVLILVMIVLYGLIRSNRQINRVNLLYLILTLVGLVFHFFVFTEMNIEFIHALEFGLLAVLIYPITGRFGAAIVYSLPVMLFDEWYQYQVLFDYVEYFDFNDLVLDLLGAGFTLSLLGLFGAAACNESVSVIRRTELFVLFGLIFIAGFLWLSTVIVPYPDMVTHKTWLILNELKEDYGFWRIHPFIGSTYHVIEPLPGMIAIFSMSLAYLGMDQIRSTP